MAKTKKSDAPEQDQPSVGAGIPNIENLKAVLENHPHVHTIFVNENGEWFFAPRPGFEPYEREDIFNG